MASTDTKHHVVIRLADAADGPQLKLLSDLDSAEPPAGPVLLAELGGAPVAALPLNGGAAIADPFLPTRDLVELLRLRARQLSSPQGRSRLSGLAAPAGQPVGDASDRLHRLLERAHVTV